MGHCLSTVWTKNCTKNTRWFNTSWWKSRKRLANLLPPSLKRLESTLQSVIPLSSHMITFFLVPQILAHSAPRAGLPRPANPAAQRAAARGEQIIRISQITNRQKLARIRRKLKLAHPSMKAQLARLRSPKICSLRLSLVHYKTHCLLLTQTLLLLLLLRGLVSIIRPVKRRTL